MSTVTPTLTGKPDAVAAAAVDAGSRGAARRRAGRRRGRPPRRTSPRASAWSPTCSPAPGRLPRLALVGHRGPRLPAEGRVTVDEVVLIPGDGRDRRAAVGALQRAGPARRPLARRPAPGRGGRPAPGPDVLRRRRPAHRRRPGPDPPGRPASSAWAGSARCRSRAATRPPSGGTTATAVRTRRWPSPPRPPAPPAASCCAWPGRSRRCSGCAPTATPTTTAGWSRSTTAAVPTPRSRCSQAAPAAGAARARLRHPSTTSSTSERTLSGGQCRGRGRRRAARRRRQYSSPNRPSAEPGQAGPQPPAAPGVVEPSVERQQRHERDEPECRPHGDGPDAVDVERLDVGDDVGPLADLVMPRSAVLRVHDRHATPTAPLPARRRE